MKHYEAVFILTPVLSESQVKETAEKFKNYLAANGAEVYHEESWGLMKLAYLIESKSSGHYILLEFKADPQLIRNLEIEFRREERIIRYLTLTLDKHAVEFNEKRRGGAFRKTETQTVAK